MKKSRLKFVLGVTSLLFAASSMSSQLDTTYNFRVLLDDKPIGFHQFELSQNETVHVVDSEASFDVKFLFVTAFKYRHSSSETWNDNCLIAIDTKTSSNGKQQEVKGERVDSVLKLDSPVGEKNLDGCVQTFAYWNPDILQATRLLNSQTGEYVDVKVMPLGDDEITLGDTTVQAVKYKIESVQQYTGEPVDITLWYDVTETRWLALESAAKGDRTLRYELQPTHTTPGAELSATTLNGRRQSEK